MSASSLPILLVVVALVATFVTLIYASHERTPSKRRLVGGLFLRLVGSMVYLFVIGALYGGGDYVGYEREGESISAAIRTGGWGMAQRYFWANGNLVWGTDFMYGTSGVIKYFTGANVVVMFLMFSMLGFVGCWLTALAIRQVYGEGAYGRVLTGIMWLPSLWFWPSALGKDAIVLLGIGLASLGFVLSKGVYRWPLLLLGIVLVFLIRPQMAVVLTFAVATGYTLGSTSKWTTGRVVQTIAGLVLLGTALYFASDALGFSVTSSDEVDTYISGRATASSYGGSAIELSGPDWLLPFLGFGTAMFRPFFWEASGVSALISALEILFFWVWVWTRRHAVMAFIRHQPRTRLFWFSAAFIIVYATSMGMAVGNLGTLVRQRVHLFPFLFLFAAAVPVRQRARQRVAQLRARATPALAT